MTGMVVQVSRAAISNTAVTAAVLAGVAVAVAGCGSGGSTAGGRPVFSSTANPFAGSGSVEAGSPGDGSPPAAAPSTPAQQPSSPPPQANPGYPYDPGGLTYSGGVGGGVQTFRIPAGYYVLNQQANYNAATDADGSGTCLFGGELDFLSGSGGSIPLGDNAVPISSWDPIAGPATKITLGAGDYRFSIFPETTCSWTVTLVP